MPHATIYPICQVSTSINPLKLEFFLLVYGSCQNRGPRGPPPATAIAASFSSSSSSLFYYYYYYYYCFEFGGPRAPRRWEGNPAPASAGFEEILAREWFPTCNNQVLDPPGRKGGKVISADPSIAPDLSVLSLRRHRHHHHLCHHHLHLRHRPHDHGPAGFVAWCNNVAYCNVTRCRLV